MKVTIKTNNKFPNASDKILEALAQKVSLETGKTITPNKLENLSYKRKLRTKTKNTVNANAKIVKANANEIEMHYSYSQKGIINTHITKYIFVRENGNLTKIEYSEDLTPSTINHVVIGNIYAYLFFRRNKVKKNILTLIGE